MAVIDDLVKLQRGITREKTEDMESFEVPIELSAIDAKTFEFFSGLDNNLAVERKEPTSGNLQYELQHEDISYFCVVLLTRNANRTNIKISMWRNIAMANSKLPFPWGLDAAREYYPKIITSYREHLSKDSGVSSEREIAPMSNDYAAVGHDVERKFFDKSQSELLEIIGNLYKRAMWPKNYHLGYQHGDNTMNEIRVDVEKERQMTDEELAMNGVTNGNVKTFERIGYFTIGKITNEMSTLEVRRLDAEVSKFFDELIAVLAEYADLHEHIQPEVNEQNAGQIDGAKVEKKSAVQEEPGFLRHVEAGDPEAVKAFKEIMKKYFGAMEAEQQEILSDPDNDRFWKIFTGFTESDDPRSQVIGEILGKLSKKEFIEKAKEMGLKLNKPPIIPVDSEIAQDDAEKINEGINPEIAERQNQIRELKQYGHDDKYIANKLGVSIKTVQRDKEALGILKHRKKGH